MQASNGLKRRFFKGVGNSDGNKNNVYSVTQFETSEFFVLKTIILVKDSVLVICIIKVEQTG